jgi:hypothetical protein
MEPVHSVRPLNWVSLALFLVVALSPVPASEIVRLNDDGGWCWFEDERVIVHDGTLIIGSVASGHRDPARKGNIEVATYELATGKKHVSVLHRNLELDDHDSPVLLVRPDGRLLTLYSKHGPESHFYYRISTAPNDATRWQPERRFTPTESSRITYSNLHFLSEENGGKGRIYDFYRGLDNSFKPSYAYSDDRGESWNSGNVFIDVPTQVRHRPYVKYASNGADTVHVFYTEGHPRDFDNAVYHVFYRRGDLHHTGGQRIRSLGDGLLEPSEGTLVFAGDPDNVAWVADLHLDGSGRPVGVFSVQKDSAGLPPGQGGDDHRYRYARWSGDKWETHEIGYAGTRLYPREDDYTGGIALDPDDTSIIYFSTNADPATGAPLLSTSDGKRHYEIYQGVTADGGSSWSFTTITENSATDNLRPIVPRWSSDKTALLWLRGTYRSYTDYSLEIVGQIRD